MAIWLETHLQSSLSTNFREGFQLPCKYVWLLVSGIQDNIYHYHADDMLAHVLRRK